MTGIHRLEGSKQIPPTACTTGGCTNEKGGVMKQIAFVAAALALLAIAVGAQTPPIAMPEKHSPTSGEPKYEGRIEGDTIEECWTIASLPFSGTGGTCAYLHDYDEACPYLGSISPDVVYCYEPTHDMCVSISLCDSYYDTKVYVYEDGCTPGAPVACNDDNFDCEDPPVSYTSWLPEVAMYSGHTYYIVVDGYGGSCGDYVLEVEEVDCSPPCDVICQGIPEGEPTCYDGYDDQYNGGCSSFTWSYIQAGLDTIVYCGESGVYDYYGSIYRESDWYLIYPCGGVPVTVTVEAEFEVLLGFVDLRGGCQNMYLYSYVQIDACEPAVLFEYLPAGQFAIYVAPNDWLPEYECGVEYSMTIDGYTEHCDPTPVEVMTWGAVKALYR